MSNTIKNLRVFLGYLNPKDFAADLNLGTNTIYNIEKGDREIGSNVIKAIKAKFPDFNINYLFDSKQPMFLPTPPEGFVSDKNTHYGKEEYLNNLNDLKKKIDVYSKEAEALRHVIRLAFNKPVKTIGFYDVNEKISLGAEQEGGKLIWTLYMIFKKLEELQDVELSDILYKTLKQLADNVDKIRQYLDEKNSTIPEKIKLLQNLQNHLN